MKIPEKLIGQTIDDAIEIVDKAHSQGWTKISVEGESALKRAVFFEASLRGIKVTNYSPSLDESNRLAKLREQVTGIPETKLLTGQQIHKHYVEHVIPALRLDIEKLRPKSGEINSKRKDLFETLEAYNQALQKRDYFFDRGREQINVKLSFPNGVPQYVEATHRERNKTPGPRRINESEDPSLIHKLRRGF